MRLFSWQLCTLCCSMDICSTLNILTDTQLCNKRISKDRINVVYVFFYTSLSVVYWPFFSIFKKNKPNQTKRHSRTCGGVVRMCQGCTSWVAVRPSAQKQSSVLWGNSPVSSSASFWGSCCLHLTSPNNLQ